MSEPSSEPALVPGLYLVATPIGNLEDITLRALRTLRSVDRIACEDTRQTQKLLNHFEIAKPTISLHEHNERERTTELIEDIRSGKSIAVVSDAGTPAISDPGHILTRAVLEAGLSIYPIPGANAAITALIASGLNSTTFRFLGFLPEKTGARRSYLESLAAESTSAHEDEKSAPATLIFYEAPHRILETLSDLESVWGADLRIVVARELTKLHEEFLRGSVSEIRTELAARDRIRGEITLLVEPAPRQSGSGEQPASLVERLAALQSGGLSEKDALKQIARETGQGKSDLYRELQREKAKTVNMTRRS
ncbi:16S rRNA (cytidine(1402)-2'-O)-methyltransferase [Acidicapsa dinghuensis]|uniref:Ribosomal RNA small subunit methyltransferase I n=1 Tax=Acidicapsa dinghuensis TaxID=2218256 RepID=A0ABW1EIV5_9BACT|nr:16S rRNA (cytidine(1402)-2'-O)-methyltransferase [Acidicapsa dinghuensis]